MAIYTVFESVNMGSTHYAERIFDAVANVDVENGTFGYLDGLADGETHTYNFVAGTKAGKKVVVADNPAWDEDNSRTVNQRKDKYVIPAGTRFRVRVVKVNDEFGITIEGVTSATQAVVTGVSDFAENNVYLTIDASGKLVAATESAADAIMEARIERKRMIGGSLVTAAHTYGYSKAMYEARVEAMA